MQSPSFNRYSSGTLEDIAARVIAELADHFDDDDVYGLDSLSHNNPNIQQEQTNDDDDDEFEFPSLSNRHLAPIEPLIFPIFGRDLIGKATARNSNPLWKLMSEERETPESCSSSEADDLDGVPADTYCAWSPATEVRSRSAGSSKRWKIRDLLFRSNSDGKGNSVFLSSASEAKKVDHNGVDRQQSPDTKSL